MHNQDLTAGVNAGLAWYYLFAALLNAAAACYVAYMEMVSEGASRVGLAPRSRRLPDWLMVTFFGLNGVATIVILFRGMFGDMGFTLAYGLSALANLIVAIAAGADAAHFAEEKDHGHGVGAEVHRPTLNDHIPAVGLGGPVDRTLWTLIWSVISVCFQATGISYVLGGGFTMPSIFRNAIDSVSGPTTFFVGATIAFVGLYAYRKYLSNGLVAWGLMNATLLYFGLSLTDFDFRDIVVKPRQRANYRLDRLGRLLHLAWASTRCHQ